MKPLATPVLGGMVSSLLHVLIVTPVIFFWIHERRLGLAPEPVTRRLARRLRRSGTACGGRGRRWCRRRRGVRRVADGAARPDAPASADAPRVDPDGPRGGPRHRPAVGDRHAQAGPQHGSSSSSAAPADRHLWTSGTVTRQREHADARHGDVERAAAAADRRARALHGDGGVRHGWRVADVVEWDGPAGAGSANFEGGVQ